MSIAVGTDLVRVARLGEVSSRWGVRFLDRAFHPLEIQRYQSFRNAKRRSEFLASRWAAKEALYKALGPRIQQNLRFRDILVASGNRSPPRVELFGQARDLAEEAGVENINLSFSHDGDYTVAFVVVSLG